MLRLLFVLILVGSFSFSPIKAEERNFSSFELEVWPIIGARHCLKCHQDGAEAEDTRFTLIDPATDRSLYKEQSTQHNLSEFSKIAGMRRKGQNLMLAKATNSIDHEGGEVLSPHSIEFQILQRYVETTAIDQLFSLGEYWADIEFVSDELLLRRLCLSLGARLPSTEEKIAVNQKGRSALNEILDQLMSEPAFYARLAEGFDDILLTRGYDGLPERALSYTHFEKTRHWTQKHDLSNAGDANAQQKARYQLTDDYREAMLREPLELIIHLVRNELPFTGIVTADYFMASPYTARGYGIFDSVKDQFQDSTDPFEFIPV
ncbi:MAG: hypothetical protein AAF226_02285, partial [Verrucomicrobiota bacterium]